MRCVLPFVLEAGCRARWVRIVDFALLYIMLALGLNIVVGFAGLLDLGYIAFFAVGAYTYRTARLAAFRRASAVLDRCCRWARCSPAVFGVLLGAPTLRLRGDYLAIVTLGFGEIIRIFLNNLNAPINITNGPQGINRIDPVRDRRPVARPKTSEIFGITFPGRTCTTTCSWRSPCW